MAKIRFEEERCKGCELCISICPQKIISLNTSLNIKGYHSAGVSNAEKCIGCGLCALICPDVAIEIYK